MAAKPIQDRASGAIMGALIGDALALGPHWYYDLSELRRDYGDWIDGYTDPKPGRYHDGMKAGQSSQAGFILTLMLRSLVASGGYDEKDFCERMDNELFPLLDGTPVSGRATIPASPFARHGDGVSNRTCPGGKPAATPTPPKPLSAPWPLPFAMQ